MLSHSLLPLLVIAHTTSQVAGAPLVGSAANQALKARTTPTYWQPGVGTSWQIVLSGPLDANPPNVEVFGLDLFDNPNTTISSLHSKGSKVICYFSAGSLENWRPDASSFPASVVGCPLDGWPGENWLDIRSPLLQPIMSARLDIAVSKGCDGVDPDNVEGYENNSCFPLTQADSVAYMQFLAGAAHSRGLAIGLKNAGDIIPQIIGDMQWAVNEQCVQYDECDVTQPFIAAGKPVFHIEYRNEAPNVDAADEASICGDPTATGVSTLLLKIWIWIIGFMLVRIHARLLDLEIEGETALGFGIGDDASCGVYMDWKLCIFFSGGTDGNRSLDIGLVIT